MTFRVARFAGTDDDFTALAAWTDETEDELRAGFALHEGPRDHWLAWDGDRVTGVVHPWLRPDGRHTLYFGPCARGAFAQLSKAVDGECYTTMNAADEDGIAELLGTGFTPHRHEHEYELPVRVVEAPTPDGIEIITADRTTLDKLMALDCALREDVPGSEGWQADAQWFREETYDSPYFDPKTYLVALHQDRYVGLARIWLGPRPLPRLGLVGVLPAYRRRGLARALVTRALAELAGRGVGVVTAEADATNVESNALLSGLGGHITGGSIELRRR
jgi:GNAT superfamily N-acetyltransferase